MAKLSPYDNIYKWSLKYFLLRAYAWFFNRLSYRSIVVKGLHENVPPNTPILFAPNHQNALMDALAILFCMHQQLVFLARSDIFKNPVLASFLRGIKIMPVYRLRDGKEKLQKNEEIFQKSVAVLENRNRLVIFPEATHTDKRRLRTLKKGLSRVAFQAEAQNNFKLGLLVIPVGLYYNNYTGFQSVLQLNYGKAIKVADFQEDYEKDPNKAYLKLRNTIAESLRPLMIDIRPEEHIDTYEALREIYDKPMAEHLGLKVTKQADKFKADKQTIAAADRFRESEPEQFNNWAESIKHYEQARRDIALSDRTIEKAQDRFMPLIMKALLLLLTFPLFLYGFINNVFPFYIPHWFSQKKVEDKQFHSSVRFGFSLILVPLFHGLQTLAFGLLVGCWWMVLLYFLSLLPMGIIAHHYARHFRSWQQQWHYARLKKSKDKRIEQLHAQRQSIVKQMQKWIDVKP